MKKILSLVFLLLISINLIACSNASSNNNNNTSEKTNEVTRDLKEGQYEEKGEGDFLIACAGGTTENGNVPVEYVASDTLVSQIGYEAWGFDGSKLSFIYVNGILQDKQQLTDTQSTLELKDNSLKPGTYKVEVAQYENDDPNSEMVTYKTCQYEIKEK